MEHINKHLRIFIYPLGGFSLGVYAAFINALLPLYLTTFTKNAALIGLLVTISAFEGAIAPLIIGPITDHIHSRYGRRKIFILAGNLLTAVFMLFIPFVKSFTELVFVILIAGFANSITIAPYLAMISKNSTLSSRGKVSAFLSLFGLMGQVILTLCAYLLWSNKIPASAFIVIVLLFTVPTLIMVLYSRDDKTAVAAPEKSPLSAFHTFFKNETRDLFMLAIFFIFFGLNSVLPFFTLFVKEYLKLPQQEAILLYLIIIVACGIFAYPFALLGNKIGEIKAFSIGLMAFMIAALLGIFSKSLPPFSLHLLAFLAGFGNAATAVFSFTILSKMVSESEMGLASGINSFLISGFAPVAAILTGFLISIFGYEVMFILLALLTGIGLILLNIRPLRFKPKA